MLEILSNITAGQWALALAGLATLIEVVPISINPWGWLFGWIGKLANKGVMDELKASKDDMTKLKDEVTTIQDKLAQNEAEDARRHILRFGDEIKNKMRHSEEYFNQILDDITRYERYCETHPNFKNARTVATQKIIMEVYQKCVQEGSFL